MSYHSMSDPGTTYRTREEVGGVRTARDPIDYVKKLLIDSNFYTADELKVRTLSRSLCFSLLN